jgi:hypothetical protein
MPHLLALGVGTKGACVSSLHPAASAPAMRGATVAGMPAAEECGAANQPDWWIYGREMFCQLYNAQVETLQVQSDGTVQVVGNTNWTIVHGTDLSPSSAAWTGETAVYLNSESGSNPSDVFQSGNFCHTCQGGTTNNPDYTPQGGPAPITPGVEADGLTYLSDIPAATGARDYLDVGWSDAFTCAGCSAVSTLTTTFPYQVRCDAEANTGAAIGCAVPALIPTLMLSGVTDGSNPSAAMIDFMQTYNSDHWGQYPNGARLTRLNDQGLSADNRNAVCGSNFTANPLVVPNDSCDEFPFAKSRQAARMLGLTATDCGTVYMVWSQVSNVWVVAPDGNGSPWNPTQRCIIGHIPLNSNQSVGGSYSQLIQNNRLLDSDPFWIGFS